MLDVQNLIGKPKIYETKVDEYTSRFEVDYLPRGFGHSFGNAIRRAILGYNYGGAVTGIKIKGVPHEYEVVDGVKESVMDMLLNVKKLRFKIDENAERVQWHSQRFTGVGKYYSDSLKLPSGVEVLNENYYLFEITDPSVELIVDLRVEKGYGYYSIDYLRKRDENQEENDIGTILVDNDFRVVNYVTYDIEEHIDDFSGFSKDRLILELQTVSSKVSPKEILTFVGEVISSYANLLVFDESYIDKSLMSDYYDMSESLEESSSEQNVKTMPIDAIPLSERTRNALIKNKILYVEDLEKKKKSELLSMKGVGRKAVDEISESLEQIGKSLIG
ncbi:DNA-directed RNA polymerase subunit alpha C-terminal domain-containing protein [Candidatus Absconditicoccus praedator]|uniref:DNA-directed RNA polymerase subunit alpha C-terminal domain-containing protein n=1 Tax=Candidatus Absconditicoccus praedator TaxID=2735562 RepID=UPI001E4DE98C|nr:DNA-directed RNA polymerase subunit alpha C-terminal domain-containing protein [Candidatus Absconditicoccus praedator]UFX82852.1 hypothetical protein HLG78_01805 [Candidatus Absconditicoccus praedator]